jgi:hypothetical protein
MALATEPYGDQALESITVSADDDRCLMSSEVPVSIPVDSSCSAFTGESVNLLLVL